MAAPMDTNCLDESNSSLEIRYSSRKRKHTSSNDDSEDAQRAGHRNSDFIWKENNRTPNIHSFTAVSGVTENIKDLSRREVFELLFTDELVRKIISEINKYEAMNASFPSLTENELKVFVALNILMSLVYKPTVHSYWTKEKSIETPYFRKVMSRNRFMRIATSLHFANNHMTNDPLTKIREISDIMKKNFIRMYVPHKNISIDESVMQSKSRSRYVQFTRSKRTQTGIKFYKLRDSKTKYIHNFEIYLGNDRTSSVSARKNVKSLMKESGLLHKGYCLFIDNNHASPSLCRELYGMQTNVCGTARPGRTGMPPKLEMLQLEKGEATVFSTTDMAAIKWQDRKDVVLLTTMHPLHFVETENMNRFTGDKVFKPSAVVDYNKNTSGIELDNHTLSKFHTMQRCKKAYKRLFFYFIDMMLLNSYIIFKSKKKDRAFHVYKQKLAEEIIEKYAANLRVRETSCVMDSLTVHSGRHFPVRIPQTPAKGRRTSKRCVVCLSLAIRKETVYKCDACNVALCIDHFKAFHAK